MSTSTAAFITYGDYIHKSLILEAPKKWFDSEIDEIHVCGSSEDDPFTFLAIRWWKPVDIDKQKAFTLAPLYNKVKTKVRDVSSKKSWEEALETIRYHDGDDMSLELMSRVDSCTRKLV